MRPDCAPDVAVLTMSPEAHLRACGDHSLVDHFAVVASRIRHHTRRVPVQLPAVALDEVRFALLHLLGDPPQVCQVDLLAFERVCGGALGRLSVSSAALLALVTLALMRGVLDVCQTMGCFHARRTERRRTEVTSSHSCEPIGCASPGLMGPDMFEGRDASEGFLSMVLKGLEGRGINSERQVCGGRFPGSSGTDANLLVS